MENISSDKLYSMLINALSFVYDEKELNKKIIEINKKVLISSSFLGIKVYKDESESNIEFLPKPYILIKKQNITQEEEEKNITKRKRYKNISWISKNVYKSLSKNFNGEFIDYSFDNGYIVDEKYYLEKTEVDEEIARILQDYAPFKTEFIQRNSINRYSKESTDTYYEGYNVFCKKESNSIKIEPYFYFYIDDTDRILSESDIKALEFMSIGGKRSLGAGVIESIEISDEQINLKGNIYINLSMVYPKIEEVKHISNYSLENRNGFIFSKSSTNIKKPTIRMIKEGSIFSNLISGDIYTHHVENINHNIYIYGKAFMIPFGGDINE